VGEPTDSASVTITVTEADTARALGSGDVEVLGTPRALALAEAATVRAAAAAITPGQTTVGTHVELDHLLPSPVGSTVRAEAQLVDRTARRLTFEVRLTQDGRPVASGRIIRAIVDRDRFAGRASTRQASTPQASTPQASTPQASTDDRG
jgi:fluoroacetyl-CoA thioesterase